MFAIPQLAPWLDPWVQTTNKKWFGAVWVEKGNGLVRVGFYLNDFWSGAVWCFCV
jgi:hypothetical protein